MSIPVKRSFEQNIHVCRGLAIIMIIGAHSIPHLDWQANPYMGLFLDSLCNQSSVIFFFIAGYLFQHLAYKFNAASYYKSKIRNVIIPYLIVSVPALYIYTMVVQRTDMYSGFYENSLAYQIFYFLITGRHLAPLWFVPTISLFYILAPLFVRLDRYKAFYYIVPVLLILSLYLGRGGALGPIDKAIYLAPAYLFGMAFSHYRDYWYDVTLRYWPVILTICLISFGLIFLQLSQPPHLQILFKIAFAALMVTGLRQYPDLIGNRLDYLAEISFALFFIHSYVIGVLRAFYSYVTHSSFSISAGIAMVPGSLMSFIVYVALVTAISTMIVWFAQQLLDKRSRLLIGA